MICCCQLNVVPKYAPRYFTLHFIHCQTCVLSAPPLCKNTYPSCNPLLTATSIPHTQGDVVASTISPGHRLDLRSAEFTHAVCTGDSLHRAVTYAVLKCSKDASQGSPSNGRLLAVLVAMHKETVMKTDGQSPHNCLNWMASGWASNVQGRNRSGIIPQFKLLYVAY